MMEQWKRKRGSTKAVMISFYKDLLLYLEDVKGKGK
jgi:hypothetical protein